MKKISVIVPVYNLEALLPAMVQSLLSQDYPELQVIFSDDGSQDGSRAILEDLARQDDRVTVISQENAGVSAARNRALAVAKGDYIAFADGDDLLEPGYFSALANALEETGADMACCGYTRIFEKTGKQEHLPTGDFSRQTRRIVNRDGMEQLLLRPDGYTLVLWNKLFRREALLEPDGTLQTFDESLHIVEDGEYIFRSRVRSAVFLPEALYRYFVRSTGAMYASAVSERKLTELPARRKIVALTANSSPEVQALAKMKYQKSVRDLMFHAVIAGQGNAVKHLRPELKIYTRELFESPALSGKEKLKYHIYRPLIQLNLRRLGAFLMEKLSGH